MMLMSKMAKELKAKVELDSCLLNPIMHRKAMRKIKQEQWKQMWPSKTYIRS